MPSSAEIVVEHVLARLEKCRPLILGICGAQGSGKTWLTRTVAETLVSKSLRCASLSLDDLYLTRAARAEMGRQVHPLFAVRGVPGTHDIALGIQLLEALQQPGTVRLPVFDKARDDVLPSDQWREVEANCDVILIEGWCVGAKPQNESALAQPVNALEADEDADGRWRQHVNACLAAQYQNVFGKIDMLVMLQAPAFDVVAKWREEQEETLRQSLGNSAAQAAELMDRAAIERFVMFYERLTRHILAEMPSRADLVIALDEHRNPVGLRTG